MKEKGVKFKYLVGTMIEIPRGALTADEIAGVAEFFCFGTNDLTQMTLGVSRDDAASFLGPYVETEIYPKDPFEVLDRDGRGPAHADRPSKRAGRPDPASSSASAASTAASRSSVEFCHIIGLNYVSCSPFRVPDRPARGGPGGHPERPGSKESAEEKDKVCPAFGLSFDRQFDDLALVAGGPAARPVRGEGDDVAAVEGEGAPGPAVVERLVASSRDRRPGRPFGPERRRRSPGIPTGRPVPSAIHVRPPSWVAAAIPSRKSICL